jgi:hypothetical protein
VIAKVPNVTDVCAGQTLTISVTTAGTGGVVGSSQDEYRYNAGSGFSAWSTTLPSFTAVVGTNTIESRRFSNGTGCTTSSSNSVSWTVVAQPVANNITPNVAAGFVCAGQSLSATFSGASGGTGTVTDVHEFSIDGGTIYNPYSGAINTTSLAGQTVIIRTSRTATGTGCNTSSYKTISWTVVAQPASGTLTKIPNISKVCVGTNVSATATAGSGGAGTVTDVLEYRFDGTGGWTPYTSGTNLSTTGKLQVEIRTYRTATATGCTSSTPVVVSWMVNIAPVVTNNNPSQTRVYGAAIGTVTISANDGDSPGSDLSINSISYTKDGGSSVSGLPAGLGIFPNTTGANSRTWNITGCITGEGVGTYVVKVIVNDECGATHFTTFTIIVTPGLVLPIADAFYTGASFFWTTGPSSSTATLTLAATIKNQVANCGDIRTARVSFFVRSGTGLIPINGAQNLPVGYVDPSDPTVGAASVIVQYNIGNNTMLPLDIVVKVTGNYTNNVSSTYDKQITIAVPLPGGQIVGGGTLDNTTSNGYLGGNSAKQTDFSIEVKYNKSLTNPQGRIELTIRSLKNISGVVDGVDHIYKVKTTAISGLTVGKPSLADAQFSSKANLSEVLSDGSSIGIESGITLTIDLYDGNILIPRSPDKIGITLYRKIGGIWYSNNWVVNKTVMKAIMTGEVSVNGSSTPAIRIESPTPITVVPPANTNDRFNVKVLGNPSFSTFRLKLESNDMVGKITVKVVDVNGRLMEVQQNLNAGQVIEIGRKYNQGTYFAEVMQGEQRKVVKLIKIAQD